jgi:hypothetical protein
MKTLINAGSFIMMIAVARLWIEYDQIFLPKQLLMSAFIVVLTAMMTAYFYIVKPINVKRFSLVLACVLCGIAIMLSFLQHVIWHHDFNVYWKHLIILWLVSFLVPVIIGFGYSKLQTKHI